MEELAERGIVLEVCPTSNVVLGVYPTFEEHPLPALRAAGVPVTLGSDDPPYFGATIGGEYGVGARALRARRRELARHHPDRRSMRRSPTTRCKRRTSWLACSCRRGKGRPCVSQSR